jgi:hypothetical protein
MPDGGGVRQRPRQEPRRRLDRPRPGRPRRRPSTDVDELVAAAHRAIDQLGAELRRLDKENADLRDSGVRIDQIRKMLG